jgi:2-polyprenyl-3-methyl-5-hydroxy-6-metoxy-1,4-benzoquinol methylase
MTEYKDYGYRTQQYNHVHAYILNPLLNILSEEKDLKILDIGCGNGWLVTVLTELGYDAYGTDASSSGIAIEVIEHLYSPRDYFDFCKRILQKSGGGKLIVSTPYHGYLKNVALSISGHMDKHFTVLWDGGHIKFWSKKTLSSVLVERGFTDLNFIGCGRLPYLWKSMIMTARV